MNVLILNPPNRDNIVMVKEGRCMQRRGAWGYIMSPVTMVTLATLLREHGHTVTVLDCPAREDTMSDMFRFVSQIQPEVVLINTSTPTIDDDIYAAQAIKERSSVPVTTVLFGIHPSCRYTDLLVEGGPVDYCLIGEPEHSALDLVNSLARGESPEGVPGIAYMDTSMKPVLSPHREFIPDLDTLPIPDWSFVDIGKYRLPLNNEPFLLVNTNRGCPFRCTFCNAHIYYGRTPRHRSVLRIMRELTQDVERFGVTNFMFWAEEFILEKDFVLELCRAIRDSGMRIKWVCNSRVDAVDPETMLAIREAGCWNIALGIESGVQAILDRIRKRTSLDQIRYAVATAKGAGLQVTGHVIIGFPEDTRETIARTAKFIDSLDLDFVQYYCAMPYPGSELFTVADTNGWLTTRDWKRWEHNQSVLQCGDLTAHEIMKYRRKLMFRWYLTPFRMVKTFRNHIRRPSDLFTAVSRLWGFFRWM